MTPAQLATARIKGHLLGLVIIALAVYLTYKTGAIAYVIAAGILYILINAWFVISKGRAIDRAQREKNLQQNTSESKEA